jgi:Arc/MetJ-type ribon-helix-helix transcriptional regulator
MPRNNDGGVTYVTVSIPTAIADEIDKLIEQLGYWPSRSSFVREACLEKIRLEKKRAKEISNADGTS